MAKKIKKEKVVKVIKKKEIVKTPELDKDKQIKVLLVEYGKLDKKGFKEGRQLRRKLRRLGYFLSRI